MEAIRQTRQVIVKLQSFTVGINQHEDEQGKLSDTHAKPSRTSMYTSRAREKRRTVSFLRFSLSSHLRAPGPRPARSFRPFHNVVISCKARPWCCSVASKRCWYGRNFSNSAANKVGSTPVLRRLSKRRCETSSFWTYRKIRRCIIFNQTLHTFSLRSFNTSFLSLAILLSRPIRS